MSDDKLALPPGVERYQHLYVIRSASGYIVWRRGTGDNVELLYIKGTEKGEGYRLFLSMLHALKRDPPYEGKGTVFGFTRESNLNAMAFYDRQGFSLSRVRGVYAEGTAVCFSARWVDLLRHHFGE